MKYEKLARTLLASASLAALLAATPFYFDFDSKDGISMKTSQAFADDSEGEDGDSGDGDDGDDGNSDDGEDEDEDSDDGDDGDDGDSGDDGSDAGGDDSNEFVLADGTKVEISADGLNIELKYVDGSTEEIQNGIYEKKDTNGNTIEERAATADDVARMQAVING